MRVLLIQPVMVSPIGLHRVMLLEPLGLERLAAALPEHEVAILDMRVDSDLDRALQSFQPDAVGISCSFATQVATTLRLGGRIKQQRAGTTVLVGGYHASLRPEDLADPRVDAIVRGEGELTLPEALRCLQAGGDLAGVAGLVLNRPQGQFITSPRLPITNLDDLPLPARGLTRGFRHRYYWTVRGRHAMVETTRGCPYRCTFCGVRSFHNGGVRMMSPEAVVREIAAVAEPWVIFADDDFLISPPRARRIAELISKQGLRKHYVIQTRSDTIVRHPELIAQWRRIGLAFVFLGLEKASDRELGAVAKRNTTEHNEAAVRLLRRHGIEFAGNFIADPRWDHDDFARLRQYLRDHRLYSVSFTILTPLPGTVLFDQMQGDVLTRDWERYDLMHTVLPTQLPLEDFYAEVASLWATAAQLVPWHWRALMFLRGLRAALRGELSFGHVREMEREVRAMGDPQTYLTSHHDPAAICAAAPPTPQQAYVPSDS